MNHISRSDEEIFRLSGVNLVYLGETKYGIIRDIHAPQSDPTPTPPKSSGHSSKHAGKVMCRDSSRGRKTSSKGRGNMGHGRGSHGRRPQTLSESRCANYGISVSNITTRTVRSSRQQIDYVSLNDGYEDEEPVPSKKHRRELYRPRNVPSVTRLSAHKRMSSPESIALEGETTTDTFSAVPSTSAEVPLPGIARADDILLDLVVNQPHDKPMEPEPDNQTPIATNTLEDLEAASTLLSLGDTLEETLEEEDDNTLLMPIGGANNPEDVAPQPLHLDQVSVDNVIAGLVETEQLEKDVVDKIENPTADVVVPTILPNTMNTDPPPNVQTQDDTNTNKKRLFENQNIRA